MAAPSFVSAGTFLVGASAATAAVAVPAGAGTGHIVLVHLYREATTTVTAPGGFTQVTNSPIATTANIHQQSVWWKRLTGGDAGTYSFSWTGSTYREAVATLYSGCVDTGDPTEINNFVQISDTADTVSPPVSGTTTGADRMLVWCSTHFAGTSTVSAGTPTGYTARAGAYVALAGGATTAVATNPQAAAGATGSVSGTWSTSNRQTASLVALIPAAGGGGGGSTSLRVPLQTVQVP